MDMPQHIAETIVDPLAYADFDRIHDVLTELRRTAPVARANLEGFEPFWVISKFDDVRHVERDNTLFRAGDKATVLTPKAVDAITRENTGGSPHIFRTMVHMDEPDHGSYRALTQEWFSAKSVPQLEEKIRELARTAVDEMAELGGECDFASQVALYYPLRVIMSLLGVPPEDEPLMLKLTQQIFGAPDADMNVDGRSDMTPEEQQAAIMAVAAEVFGYFNAMTQDRRKNPRDDLASIISNSRINGEPLGENEALSYYVILATAGHDTTSNSVSAGMWALCEHPEIFAAVQQDPDLIPGLVEESIRWEAPVKHFMRTATADTEIRGVPIARDDWMMLSFASACRDEEHYENPFSFDVRRSPNRHLALGFGAHVCLGQHLARLEMRILWEELLSRLESVEAAGPIRRVAAGFVSGPKSLPIRFRFK
ncbi:MAG: cytochrome P450 [Gammaproteobacteria bacterium AqS3]|nr:cytochrome P450 [Gammaproteobacteria bacterium AqS3]